MEPILFSELIKNSKLKPDLFITKKIDELDFPLKHIKFLKKNINIITFETFNGLVEIQKLIINNDNNLENQFGTETNISFDIDKNNYDLIFLKKVKECSPSRTISNLNFDDRILDDEFIDLINKRYVLISLVFAISFEESFKFARLNSEKYNLNSRIIIDEILSFWTNNFKNEFCYLEFKDLNNDKIYNQKEIEHCIIQFYFNYYYNMLIDDQNLSGDKLKVINRITEEKLNYKWYVIFGLSIWNRMKNNFKNPDESLKQGLLRFKDLDYKFIDNFLANFMN